MQKVLNNFNKKFPEKDIKQDFFNYQEKELTLFTSFPVLDHIQSGSLGNKRE